MLKVKLIIIATISYVSLVGQAPTRLKKIVEIRGSDTLNIEVFNESHKRVFWKSFPQYGASQILTYRYSGNKLTHSVWSHSNMGYIISDYIYDSASNTRMTYAYETEKKDKNKGIDNLMSFQNEEDLENSQSYLRLYRKENRFLKEIAFYRDSFLTKQIAFDQKKDTTFITTYEYENNLLKDKRVVVKYRHNAFDDVIYDYDSSGNEIQWMKVFNDIDTAYVVKKMYLNSRLVESLEIEHHKQLSKTKFEYSKEMLQTETEYDAENRIRRKKKYYYDTAKKLIRMEENSSVRYYIYE